MADINTEAEGNPSHNIEGLQPAIITMRREYAGQMKHRGIFPRRGRKTTGAVFFEIGTESEPEHFTVKLTKVLDRNEIGISVAIPASEVLLREHILQRLYRNTGLIGYSYMSMGEDDAGAPIFNKEVSGMILTNKLIDSGISNMDLPLFSMSKDSYDELIGKMRREIRESGQVDGINASPYEDRVGIGTNYILNTRLSEVFNLYVLKRLGMKIDEGITARQVENLLTEFYRLVIDGDDSELGHVLKAKLPTTMYMTFMLGMAGGLPGEGKIEVEGLGPRALHPNYPTPIVLWEGMYFYIVSTDPNNRWRIRIKHSDLYRFERDREFRDMWSGIFSLDNVNDSTIAFPKEAMSYEEYHLQP